MKLPMIRTGLPALRGQTKAPVKKNFDQALVSLRKASGKPEYRHVPMRCAIHDKPFVVMYRRDDPDCQFRVEKISKEGSEKGISGGMIGRLLAGKSENPAVYDDRDFNSAGRYCPWCSHHGMAVHCSECRETYCGGRVVESGNAEYTYRCVPRCGSEGPIIDYDKVHGNRAVPPLQKRHTPLLAKSEKKALPPPRRPLLPGW